MLRLSRLSLFPLICTVLITQVPAKLSSPSYQEERAAAAVELILKETRLEDDSHWGPQFQSEIDQATQLFGMNYYQIFADLKIRKAMARCAVYAKNESDFQMWLDMMARFDQAAEELNSKDKGRYYIARGLAILYAVPDKIRDLPDPFFKAAENGYASSFLAEYVEKIAGRNTGITGDIYERLARSYTTGRSPQEAYKFYLLALKSGRCNSELILEMVQAAGDKGSDSLAYRTGLLFLALFDPNEGARSCYTPAAAKIPITTAMAAEQAWDIASSPTFDTVCAALALMRPVGKTEIKERDLNRFDSKYVQTIIRFTGSYSDLFVAALCDAVWGQALMVKRFATRVAGPITESRGIVAQLAQQIREDSRLASDPDLAKWEAQRWKKADKLDDFITLYPQRAQLAGVQ